MGWEDADSAEVARLEAANRKLTGMVNAIREAVGLAHVASTEQARSDARVILQRIKELRDGRSD